MRWFGERSERRRQAVPQGRGALPRAISHPSHCKTRASQKTHKGSCFLLTLWKKSIIIEPTFTRKEYGKGIFYG